MRRPTEPEFGNFVPTSEGLRVAGRIPEDLAYFEGHFPGHPVVPGVVLLHWALRLAARELDAPSAPSALEALKFQAPLLPGAAFELEVFSDPERLRFRYSQQDAPIASGRARWENPPSAHSKVSGNAGKQASGVAVQLPQQGNMRLLDRVRSHAGSVILCEGAVQESTPLCEQGTVPSWLAVEWLAQGMAAAGGARVPVDTPPPRGFLASARRITLRTDRFRVGERLWVRAKHLRGDHGAVSFDCALGVGDPPEHEADVASLALASGALTAFVEATT